MQIVVDNDGYFYYKFINTLIFTNDYQTTVDNIYAGGDNITGPMTVIKAMEAGRKSAKLIDSQLK